MNAAWYLESLDETLRLGIAGMSGAFVQAQVEFVLSCQQEDDGFCGRQGGSDLYYTDFALRTLSLLGASSDVIWSVGNYLDGRARRPMGNVIECFCFLNALRVLKGEKKGAKRVKVGLAESGLEPILLGQLGEIELEGGGFARSKQDRRLSAYATFLGSLCYAMMGKGMARADEAIGAIQRLKRADGGYAEQEGETESQTNATAAAVGFLLMHEALTEREMSEVVDYLHRMQTEDGGFRSHGDIGRGDLLSTFTGLLTVHLLDGLQQVDLRGVARFVREVSCRHGGFLACVGDDSADVEYTFYGVGTLGLLRGILATS